MKKIIYYTLNLFFHTLDRDVIKYLKNSKNIVVFDVGCYRGSFSKQIFNKTMEKKSVKFYLFDPNRNVKRYIKDLINKKNFLFTEAALSDKNGKANYNHNSFFEASGSSLSTLTRNDKKWIFSRKLILKFLLQKTGEFLRFSVPTITIDLFVKKNKIKKIDILKIDVDGTEQDILIGAKKTLKENRIKIILIEIAATKKNYNKKEKKIINFLAKMNYDFKKKYIMSTPSFFSNIKAGDYLFLNKNFF
jgi:FkbM family methyltransferase